VSDLPRAGPFAARPRSGNRAPRVEAIGVNRGRARERDGVERCGQFGAHHHTGVALRATGDGRRAAIAGDDAASPAALAVRVPAGARGRRRPRARPEPPAGPGVPQGPLRQPRRLQARLSPHHPRQLAVSASTPPSRFPPLPISNSSFSLRTLSYQLGCYCRAFAREVFFTQSSTFIKVCFPPSVSASISALHCSTQVG
jgi:hypothetical protein